MIGCILVAFFLKFSLGRTAVLRRMCVLQAQGVFKWVVSIFMLCFSSVKSVLWNISIMWIRFVEGFSGRWGRGVGGWEEISEHFCS